jgi:carbamate kinase
MRVLIALGGNAMTGPGGSATPQDQDRAIGVAMQRVADLVTAGTDVVLTHGNGPQVGNLLVKNELAAHVVPPVPLDWCGAQTQGTIGFLILDSLDKALADRGVDRPTATVVTRTLVDGDDPGFRAPTKPVGRYLPEDQARTLIEHGQTWEDRGAKGWRRVVASPEPLEVLDAGTITTLADAGYVVVGAGGGGIPVVRDPDGTLHGVEAVIDKDLAAALLARAVDAEVLVIATDVEHVVLGYGTEDERPLRQATAAEMREIAHEQKFASGSMGPKVEAAVRFVESGGRRAVITSLEMIEEAVHGRAGTVVEEEPA